MPNHFAQAAVIALLRGLAVTTVAAPETTPPSEASTPEAKSTVQISITDNQVDETEGIGFVLHIVGWKPSREVSIYLVGPKGERVDVAPVEKPVTIAVDGIADIFIPYAW